MNGNNITIAASPEKILQKATEAKVLCERLIENLNTIDKRVNASSYFWESESARFLGTAYRADKPDLEALRAGLSKQIKSLEEIALMYHKAEASTKAAHTALPGNVLE